MTPFEFFRRHQLPAAGGEKIQTESLSLLARPMKNHVEIGKIYREHGLKGLCKVYTYSLGDENLLEGQSYVLVSETGEKRQAILQTVSAAQKFFLVNFDCFTGADQVLAWRKAKIWMPAADVQREPGEILDSEWKGFVIFDEAGTRIGEIVNVIRNPLRQFVVESGGAEVLIPGVDAWILEHNANQKTLKMSLPEGLLDIK